MTLFSHSPLVAIIETGKFETYIYIYNYIYMCVCHKLYIGMCSWWRHQMETFSALLAICAGNSPVSGEFPAQRPVTRSFDVFFDLCPNKRLSKQSWCWWFETPSAGSLWRHSNVPRCFSRSSYATLYKLNQRWLIISLALIRYQQIKIQNRSYSWEASWWYHLQSHSHICKWWQNLRCANTILIRKKSIWIYSHVWFRRNKAI